MDEEKPTGEGEAVEDTGEGVQPKATGLIDSANTAAKRLEEANKKQEELLNRQEEIFAKQQLAGRAEAGSPPPKEEEVDPKQYATEVLEGKHNVKKE